MGLFKVVALKVEYGDPQGSLMIWGGRGLICFIQITSQSETGHINLTPVIDNYNSTTSTAETISQFID